LCLLAACAGTPAPATETTAPTETPRPTAPPVGPISVPFKAADGVEVEGMYYPAAAPAAPLVVMLHGGDESLHLWDAVAPWLQNRGAVFSGERDFPFRDPAWFPAIPAGRSYAVFTFTSARPFRELLTDAEAAIQTARAQDGVDPDRMVLVGSSSGADGAIDSCGAGCVGVFSLSPGNYLGRYFIQEAMRLSGALPPVPVMCLASKGDPGPPVPTCQSSEGQGVEVHIYDGSYHGVEQFNPDYDPQPLQLLLSFLLRVTGS
jgi:dienelactone hydrolase